MIYKPAIIFLSFFLTTTLNAQYLEFDDMIHLIKIAEDRSEVEEFMKTNAFDFYDLEFINQEDDEDTTDYRIDYNKKLYNDDLFIRIVGEIDSEIYSVGEYSDNEDRWDYYVSIISAAELEPADSWENDEEEGYRFETDDYIMTLKKLKTEENTRYSFFISGY